MVLRDERFLLLLVFLCNLQPILSQTKSIDKEFLECYSKDKTKLENCIAQFWDKLAAKMKTGDPSLNITKEPMIIKEIIWKETNPSLNVHSVLSNIKIWGFSSSKITEYVVDKKAKTITFNAPSPYINITTDFVANGTVILLQVNGKGKVSINATNVIVYGKGKIVPNGSGIKVQNLKCNIDVQNIDLKFTDVDANAKDPIWEALSKLVSENINLLFEDIKPSINSRLSTVLEEMTIKAYAKIPMSVFND